MQKAVPPLGAKRQLSYQKFWQSWNHIPFSIFTALQTETTNWLWGRKMPRENAWPWAPDNAIFKSSRIQAFNQAQTHIPVLAASWGSGQAHPKATLCHVSTGMSTRLLVLSMRWQPWGDCDYYHFYFIIISMTAMSQSSNWLVCWSLVAQHPSNMLANLKDSSAQTIVHAPMLR